MRADLPLTIDLCTVQCGVDRLRGMCDKESSHRKTPDMNLTVVFKSSSNRTGAKFPISHTAHSSDITHNE